MATATAQLDTAPTASDISEPRSKRRLILGLIAGAVIAGGGFWYLSHRGLESTDNAQIDGEVVSVPGPLPGTPATSGTAVAAGVTPG